MKNLKYNINSAVLVIASLGLLSRIIGFFRESALASRFGAGEILDIYYTAFRLPDIVYSFLILGSLTAAFIPVFLNYMNKDKKEAELITNSILWLTTLVMLFVAMVVIILAEPLTRILAPGFEGARFDQTVSLTRIMMLSPILFTASSVLSGYVTAFGRFVAAGIAPVVYNLGIIFGLFVLYPVVGIQGLGIGVIIGALLHLSVQLFASQRVGLHIKPVLQLNHPGVKQIGKLMLPRMLSMDLSYVSLIIASIIGSTLSVGSIAVFNLANNLQAVAVGVFALSAATAVFPLLSNLFSAKKYHEYIFTIRDNIIQIGYFMIPMTVIMLIFRAHIVRLAYGYGNFDWQNTILTFNILGIMAFALLSQSLIPLLSRAFYAQHDTETPLIISLFVIVINVVVSIVSVKHYGISGIALGFTVASNINLLLLFILFRVSIRRKLPDSESSFDLPILTSFTKIAVATLLTGTVAYTSLYMLGYYLNTQTVAGIFSQTVMSGALAGVVYGLLTHWLGFMQPSMLHKFAIKPWNYIKNRG